MTKIELGNERVKIAYEVSEAGTNADGSTRYSIRVNYGWKTPYLKEGSPRFIAVLAEYQKRCQQ